MIELAIVEDEEVYASQLVDYIKKFEKENGYQIMISRFSDGDEITSKFRCQFDIILMDIEMKFMNGMEAAEEIRKKDKDVIIMFITNMMDYAVRGYEVDALDYVLKPVSYFSFSQKIGKAIDRLKQRSQKSISVESAEGLMKIKLDSIYYIESEGHNLIFYTTEGTIRTRANMKDLEELLRENDFYRINKGYLVNLFYVEGIEGNNCILPEVILAISRNRKNDFMKELTIYMSRG